MEIHPAVATVISSLATIGALGFALVLFGGMFALLTSEIFGRVIE